MVFKVNVQPFTASSACLLGSCPDQLGADAAVAGLCGYERIEDESVGSSVPRYVDKPH